MNQIKRVPFGTQIRVIVGVHVGCLLMLPGIFLALTIIFFLLDDTLMVGLCIIAGTICVGLYILALEDVLLEHSFLVKAVEKFGVKMVKCYQKFL